MPRTFSFHHIAGGALLAGVAACAGGTTTTSTSETAALVETAQCNFQADRAAADACFQAFDACVAATGSDVEACRATLQSCLPPPPPPRGPGGHHGPPPLLPDGGLPPPPPGGLPPPGGDGRCPGMDGGMGPHGPGGPGGRGGPGGPDGMGPRPEPDSAAVEACHAVLSECLATTPGANCFELEHQCMHDAFAAAFDAVCNSTTCDPTTDPDCARLLQRCAEGVAGRPESFDGGACP